MRPLDAVALRCRATYPVRRAVYDRLARGVADARRPAGVVFESTDCAPVPWMIVRPAELVDDLDLAGLAPSGSFDRSRVVDGARPRVGMPDTLFVVEPDVAVEPVDPPALPPASPHRPLLLGHDGWLAWQTFWVAGGPGVLWVARRFRFAAPSVSELRRRTPPVGAAAAFDWELGLGRPAHARQVGWGARRAWRRRTLAGIPRSGWSARRPSEVGGSAEAGWLAPEGEPRAPAGHTIVFGASGAGKTTYLAQRAAEAIRRGDRVVAIDLHGDLAPAIAARLDPDTVERLVAIDADRRPVPGIAAIGGVAGDDRAAALLVAAVKRLSPDGADVYWGFRLERIFDTMVRLVQESGGSLLDLYELLTSAERRDVARLATRRPELAEFLEELGPVVRRTPDFLWPAAARLSKVVLVPSLAELLAPADGGIAVEERIAEGRPLLVRLPFARLGPEAAALASTFVLARVFLGVAGGDGALADPRPLLLVLDEVHAFSPRLVEEVLAESRKFGVRALVATQYPERLAPEVRAAAAGASARCVVFRVPPPSAAEAGSWLGLDRATSERTLPALAPGRGVELDPDRGGWHSLEPVSDVGADVTRWNVAVGRTRDEFPPVPRGPPSRGTDDPAVERILLAVLSADEAGCPLREADVVPAAERIPGRPVDPAALADRWRSIVGAGWAEPRDSGWHLTPAGERWLGLGAPTLATRESPEHRRLLLRAFRIFARHGGRLEIVRQDRFDTSLPDARFRQLPRGDLSPAELAETLDRARRSWAWRYFGGRDVHVEAEVSGALRAERVRRGWAKARGRDAFVLFVVGDAGRARRVRTALERAGVSRDRAGVWTLPPTAPAKP